MATLPVETLNWLLENENPPVRNLTKEFLLSEEISEEELQEVNNYKPIKTILSLMKNESNYCPNCLTSTNFDEKYCFSCSYKIK